MSIEYFDNKFHAVNSISEYSRSFFHGSLFLNLGNFFFYGE
jgi:hypothetical protein